MRLALILAGLLAVLAPAGARALDLVELPAGTVVMGDPAGEADETAREVALGAFRLMRHETTNAEFAAFVAATGHVSSAERSGKAWVWDGRWNLVAGADWRNPFGPATTIAGKADHPVVQVSVRDARAFCAFHGLRLPTEAEWERAARGERWRRYPWGDGAPDMGGLRRANFGTVRCCAADAADGFAKTAPVGQFRAGLSPFGLADMAGNVWEWTATLLAGDPKRVILKGGGWGNDPYCLRIGYHHTNPPGIGLDMVGFRCAGDVN